MCWTVEVGGELAGAIINSPAWLPVLLYKQWWCGVYCSPALLAPNNLLYFSLTLPSPPVWLVARQLSNWPAWPPPRPAPTSRPWGASTLGLCLVFPPRLSMDSLLPLWPPLQVGLTLVTSTTTLSFVFYQQLRWGPFLVVKGGKYTAQTGWGFSCVI